MIRRPKHRALTICIVLGIILCAAFVYANIYSKTLIISQSYSGISYAENSEHDIKISFDITLEKRLFYDDLIDGTIGLNGKTYEVSNHNAFFTGVGVGEHHYDSGIRPFLTRLKDRINHAPYDVNRIVIHLDGSNHSKTYDVTFHVTRDFEMIAGTVFEESGNYNFTAPAQSMDDVRKVEAVIFNP